MRVIFQRLLRQLGTLAFTMATMAMAAPDSNTAAHENARRLIADGKCESCHKNKVGGDGSAIYLRKDRRVTTKNKLLLQVARCNSDLNLGLFPEDEAAIAAYLNEAHYKFKD